MVISARRGKAQLRAGAMRKAHILVTQGSDYPLARPSPRRFQLQSIEFLHALSPLRFGHSN